MCSVTLVVIECRNNGQVLVCGRHGLNRQFILSTCAKEHANPRFVGSRAPGVDMQSNAHFSSCRYV
jgi:hypothetical protein